MFRKPQVGGNALNRKSEPQLYHKPCCNAGCIIYSFVRSRLQYVVFAFFLRFAFCRYSSAVRCVVASSASRIVYHMLDTVFKILSVWWHWESNLNPRSKVLHMLGECSATKLRPSSFSFLFKFFILIVAKHKIYRRRLLFLFFSLLEIELRASHCKYFYH